MREDFGLITQSVAWATIDSAPRDGRPVWVRGWDWGKPDTTRHFGWAFHNGTDWCWAEVDRGLATHLTDWMLIPNYEALNL